MVYRVLALAAYYTGKLWSRFCAKINKWNMTEIKSVHEAIKKWAGKNICVLPSNLKLEELPWFSINSLTVHLNCVIFCYADLLSLGFLLLFSMSLHTTGTIFSCVPRKFCRRRQGLATLGSFWGWLRMIGSPVAHLYMDGPSWLQMPLWQVQWWSCDFSAAKDCLQPQRNGCTQHAPASLVRDTSPSSLPDDTWVAKPTFWNHGMDTFKILGDRYICAQTAVAACWFWPLKIH